MQRRTILRAAALPAILAAPAVHAQRGFATRPIRIVVGVAPGIGTIDLTARAVADPMAEALGQPVVVENRPGAGGIIAAEAAARAAPDGHTLFLGGADTVVHAFLLADRPPLDPFKDFTPVSRATKDHWLVVAAPSLGVSTVAELAEAGRRRQGELNYASFGPGTVFHLVGARLAQRLGFEAVHVPYRGDYTSDLLAGRISYLVQPSALLLPHVQAGKLKALATLSPQRLPQLPEVPTIAEAGFPDLGFNMGIILWAPGGTSPEIVGQVNAAYARAAANPAVKGRLADLSLETVGGSVPEAAEFTRWFVGFVDDLRGKVLGKAR
ncbi:Bug family tripartite tricarboxylate transporter substrate binding protein [Pararoseomonas indoligenes]|uniref:Tripartite tricarboxylate transporter substrate binding protein n=1 Tax=Roseomonas indoligenes TaxID=2820811 RepID=A0A940MZ38_9PROT|nr:tripartite tricarboxylate transporter substrate binding protein [Pararoseomonas indoligenes]MBP0493509.1 tripartite tricarboxylate transporter substrate binding protein [Pararoseomonas indoligenes]